MTPAISMPLVSLPRTRGELLILRLLPSLTDLAFFIPALLLFFCLPGGVNTLLGDGDTGWHIRAGEWMIAHHAVPVRDLFSYTMPDRQWFAWEWGWDVAFASIHHAWGLAGVLFCNLTLLCLVSALLFRLVRRVCDHDLFALAVSTLAVLASTMHWLARPHLLSWVFFLLLLHTLRATEEGNLKALRWTPLLMLFWTNMHGSFFLGIFMLVLAALGACCEQLFQAAPDYRQLWLSSRPYWFYAALCSAVTLVNPYGWRVHQHIFGYIRNSGLLDQIQEFQSTSFHHIPAAFFELMLLPGLAAALWCAQRKRWTAALGILTWAHFSLVAARNIPMFVFVASPCVAAFLADIFNRAETISWARVPALWARGITSEIRPFERAARWHVVTALVIAFWAISFAGRQSGFEANFPAKQFPQPALSVIAAAKPAHIFTSDQWGDFLIYHLYPSTKVFVDGRSDFYGSAFLESCRHIMGARWDWETNLNRYLVDMVIVTPDTPVATVLKSSPHWSTLFDNGSVIVFGNRSAAVSSQNDAERPIRDSAVVRSGGNQLGAGSACKYRT